MTDYDVDMQAREDARVGKLPKCNVCLTPVEGPLKCENCEEFMCGECSFAIEDFGIVCARCYEECS